MLSSRVLQASYHLSQHRTSTVVPIERLSFKWTPKRERYSNETYISRVYMTNPSLFSTEAEWTGGTWPFSERTSKARKPSSRCRISKSFTHPNFSTTAIAVQFPNPRVLKLINRRINLSNRVGSPNTLARDKVPLNPSTNPLPLTFLLET